MALEEPDYQAHPNIIAPEIGDVPQWDGENWVPVAVSSSSSDDLGFYGASPVAAASRLAIDPTTATPEVIYNALVAFGLFVDGS